MKIPPMAHTAGRLALLLLLAGFCSCRSLPSSSSNQPTANPSIRFLLTFDDGPSARMDFNSTLAILDQLATNDVQCGVCALFFTQPVHPRGGGAPKGREVMRKIHAQGHILGIHSVSPRGHVDHTTIATHALVLLLKNAKHILRDISGTEPVFVRPPYGVSNPATRAIYQELNLNLLLADVSARDGIIYGYNGSLSRRWHIRFALAAIREKREQQPDDGSPWPVTISFHDVNPYTARHMTEYLHILVEEAGRVGLALPAKPFYDTIQEVTAVGIRRRLPPPPSIP